MGSYTPDHGPMAAYREVHDEGAQLSSEEDWSRVGQSWGEQSDLGPVGNRLQTLQSGAFRLDFIFQGRELLREEKWLCLVFEGIVGIQTLLRKSVIYFVSHFVLFSVPLSCWRLNYWTISHQGNFIVKTRTLNNTVPVKTRLTRCYSRHCVCNNIMATSGAVDCSLYIVSARWYPNKLCFWQP